MPNAKALKTSVLIFLLFPLLWACSSDNLTALLDRVENLNISRQGYTLGKKLSREQEETARKNAVPATDHRTRKFRDGNLYVVTEGKSNRVVVLYEQHEAATRELIQNLVGSLTLEFGEPTVMAHEKTLYWIYGPKGKLPREQYQKAKKEEGNLNVLATVKLSSTLKILQNRPNSGEDSVYYIISSEPVLKLLTE